MFVFDQPQRAHPIGNNIFHLKTEIRESALHDSQHILYTVIECSDHQPLLVGLSVQSGIRQMPVEDSAVLASD